MGLIKKLGNFFTGKSGKVSMAEAKRMAKMQESNTKEHDKKRKKITLQSLLEPVGPYDERKGQALYERRVSERNARLNDEICRTVGTGKTSFRGFGTCRRLKPL